MDWLNRMNEAVSYIEDHLDQDIDYQEVARLAYCSEHHFKRMFSFIAGITLKEYIRRRRLTLAALEMKDGRIRVIDAAVKYGYHSADSFSRAFQSMHGVAPSLAKKDDISLKAYPRMTFHISIKGDAEMNYRFVRKEAFTLVGFKEKVSNEEGRFHPQIWEQQNEDLIIQLEELADTELTGILHVTANVSDESLDYYMAVATTKPCPEGFSKLSVPAATWAVFNSAGPSPEAMLTTWERVYTDWFPTSGYELAQAPEFVHGLEMESEIWIPVNPK